MSDREFHEKQEEKEYEYEKQDEKARGGGGDEKWRRDPLGSVVWAGILIWAGLVLMAQSMGFLHVEAWPIICIGASVIVFLEALVRMIMPAYRRPIGGTLFWAIVLMGIGLGNMMGWQVVGPLILIALGLSVLMRGFFQDR